MNKFNFLLSLFNKAGFLGKSKSAQDIPELTNFLKNNEAFKAACWKVKEVQKNIIKKLDEEVGYNGDDKKDTKKIDRNKK